MFSVSTSAFGPVEEKVRLFFGPFFFRSLFVILSVEILSFLAFLQPSLQPYIFVAGFFVALFLSLRDIRCALYLVLGELFMGGLGYLFWIDISGFRLSFRLALFFVLLVAGVFSMVRQKKVTAAHSKIFFPYVLWMVALAAGILTGIVRGNPLKDVFFDVNGYFFYFSLFVFFHVITSWKVITEIFSLWLSSIAATFLKVVFLLYGFTHKFDGSILTFLYRWVRDTRVGEITEYPYFYRIFFQSHIYIVLFFLFTFLFLGVQRKKDSLRRILVLPQVRLISGVAFACLFVIFLGYSRSFWVGTFVGVLLLMAVFRFFYHLSFSMMLSLLGFFLSLGVLSIVFLGIVVKLPSPLSGQRNAFSALGFLEERTEIAGEAAAGSRFELLGPLLTAIGHHPLIGSGFGTSVSYYTQDPRAKLSHPDGLYTTYTFEWGYLDTLTEVGGVGFLVFLFFLVSLMRQGWNALCIFPRSSAGTFFAIFFLLGLGVLLSIHTFTPFLNHPLGIVFLLLSASFFHFLHTSSKESHA